MDTAGARFFVIQILLVIFFCELVGAGSTAVAAPGDLDPTFGTSGIARGPEGAFTSVGLQKDGRIVAAGATSDRFGSLRVVRLRAGGGIDPTFGTRGIVDRACPDCLGTLSAMTIQDDGRIITAGRIATVIPGPRPRLGPAFLVLGRYHRDGTADDSFEHDYPFGETDAAPTALLSTPDGGTIIAGTTEVGKLVFARVDRHGGNDASFGVDGLLATDLRATVVDLALEPDGKILAAGSRLDPDTFESDVLVLRLLADGRLDPDFGTGGAVVLDLFAGGDDRAQAVALEPDGKLVVGATGDGFLMARVDAKGRLDPTFGSRGTVRSDAGTLLLDLLRQRDGKLVALGSNYAGGDDRRWVLARFDRRGSPDSTFGDDGRVLTETDPEGGGFPVAVFQQADAKLLAVGNGSRGLVAVRYLGDSAPPRRRALPYRRLAPRPTAPIRTALP